MIKRYAEHILINTKMNRPTIVGKSVLRPRLMARLDEGLQQRITLISAPAGFGKTTLAVQWLEQNPGLSAWMSLERNDSNPEIFLRYLVAAIQSVVPSFGKQVWSLLSAVRLPPPDYLADAMLSELTSLSEPVLIVLDDYHSIVSDDVHKIVIRILTHLPEKVHIAILTRKDPPWPIGRWRTLGWINELRAADLSFSREETETLVVGNNFSPETVDILFKETEGWIAGLRLLLMSLSDKEDPVQFAQSLSGSDRLIVDFLMEEVLSHQPREILDFLTISSMFDRFCAPLCDFLLADVPDREPSDKTIAYLERENLFLVQLDREKLWYRYHHFFQMLLEKHVKVKMSKERLHYLYRRAGEWFAGRSMIEEAIKCYISARDIDAATQLIEENLHDIIDEDLSRRRLKRLLEFFPPQAESSRPVLLIAHAYVQLFSWNFPAVKEIHEKAEELLHKLGDSISESRRLSFEGDLEAQKAFRLYQLGDVKAAVKSACRTRQLVPKEHLFAYGLAIMYTAAGYAATGRKEQSLRLLQEITVGSVDSGSKFAGQVGVAQMAIHYYAGDLNRVLDAAELMLARNEKVRVPDYYLGLSHFFRGSVAYERNQLTDAVKHFETVAGMRYYVMPSLYHDCLIGLALVALAQGEAGRAGEYVREAVAYAKEAGDSYPIEISRAMTARLAILSGESSGVSLNLPSFFEGNRFWLLTPSLIRLENAILQRKAEVCQDILPFFDARIKQAEQFRHVRQIIQFLAVKAVALKCAGKTAAALRVLEKALLAAIPLGFVRTFIDRGPLMADLLTLLLKNKPWDRYLRSLLIAFDAEKAQHERTDDLPDRSYREPSVQATASTLQDELTNREIEILLLLEKRLSNKEIATKLFISPETVKRHTINIYHKLKVNNRRAAIFASKKFGLIGSQHPAS